MNRKEMAMGVLATILFLMRIVLAILPLAFYLHTSVIFERAVLVGMAIIIFEVTEYD